LNFPIQAPMSNADIAYAPELLPDELLYSWLARLAALNAMGAPREVLWRIFGCRTLVPSVDLPTQLIAVQQRLGSKLVFPTLNALIEEGTLLPYHRPFLTSARHSRARDTMLYGDGKGLKTLIGRVANRFGAHPPLRSCPDCLDDSMTRHGAYYWQRKHQLPGVNYCVIHGTLLQHVPLQSRTHRQRLLLPTTVIARASPPVKTDAWQLRFAQLSQELVEAALPVIAPLSRATTYRSGALARGYGTRHNKVDFSALADAMRRQFDDFEGFEHQARLLASPVHPLGWLRPLFTKPERSLHPICHLLLIEFLFGSVAAFEMACAACDHPPHDPPLNAQSLAQAAKIHVTSSALAIDHEAALRDLSLSCRQVAKRIGKSVTTVVAWRRAQNIPIRERRKSLNPKVIDRVVKALGSQSSLAAVAARTGVSLSSAYRILAQYPSTPRPRQDATSIAQLPLRRARWMAALQACQKEGTGRVTNARTHASADYAWLYRYDRAWLTSANQNAAPVQHSIKKSGRVDWVKRDTELCQQLQQQIELLLDEAPPQRLTKTRLMSPLGETMVRRNLGRLPKLCALLDKAAESVLTFGMRRVDHAIALLVADGTHLRIWRIQRLAGLLRWPNALTTYANQRIELLNAQNSLPPHGLP